MSGRTFGVQSSWDDVFKTLGLEISPKQQRKAASIADSMNQQIEEHINRFAVSATNDKGDLTFDATGTYTFNGNVNINGALTLSGTITGSGGDIATGSTNPRVVLTEDGSGGVLGLFLPSILFYPSDNADSAGVISGNETASEYFLYAYSPADDAGAQSNPAYWSLASSGVGLLGIGTASGASMTWGDRYIATESSEIRLDNGSAASPALNFSDSQTTGMYRYAADEIGFSTGTTAAVMIDSTQYLHVAGRRLYFGINSNDYMSFNDTTNIYSWVWDGSTNVQFGSGLGVSYGTVYATGTGTGSYEGFNASGHLCLMSNDTNTGIYDDVNNSWVQYYPSLSTTLDSNYVLHMLEADAADGDLDVYLNFSTPDSDSGGGSSGTGFTLFNDEIGGSTGTGAILTTSTVNSITGKRIRFVSSKAEIKDNIEPWAMPQDDYMRIQPKSFIYQNEYVDEYGRHHNWDPASALDNNPDHIDLPPESWVPLRRFGFVWDDLMGDESLWPLATELGVSYDGAIAATVTQVQDLIRRVEALEGKKK